MSVTVETGPRPSAWVWNICVSASDNPKNIDKTKEKAEISNSFGILSIMKMREQRKATKNDLKLRLRYHAEKCRNSC